MHTTLFQDELHDLADSDTTPVWGCFQPARAKIKEQCVRVLLGLGPNQSRELLWGLLTGEFSRVHAEVLYDNFLAEVLLINGVNPFGSCSQVPSHEKALEVQKHLLFFFTGKVLQESTGGHPEPRAFSLLHHAHHFERRTRSTRPAGRKAIERLMNEVQVSFMSAQQVRRHESTGARRRRPKEDEEVQHQEQHSTHNVQ